MDYECSSVCPILPGLKASEGRKETVLVGQRRLSKSDHSDGNDGRKKTGNEGTKEQTDGLDNFFMK